MKNLVLIIVVAVVVAVAAYFYYRDDTDNRPAVTPISVPEPQPGPATPAPVKYPVPEESTVQVDEPEPEPVVLPALDSSSGEISGRLGEIHDPGVLGRLFVFDSIIRHFVVTVDNMTSTVLPQKFRVYSALPGKFMVRADTGDTRFLDPANYDRYTLYVKLLDEIDLRALVRVYITYYPLFQQAYEELGYPDRYFNDRFVFVIDHLLETPVVHGEITLDQPKVYYTFTDARLEALSAGQKILVRMGPDNAEAVKKRLRLLRALLAEQRAAGTAG